MKKLLVAGYRSKEIIASASLTGLRAAGLTPSIADFLCARIQEFKDAGGISLSSQTRQVIMRCRRFVGVATTGSPVTIVRNDLLITHSHGEHASWDSDTIVSVQFADGQVQCSVLAIFPPPSDFCLLRPLKPQDFYHE